MNRCRYCNQEVNPGEAVCLSCGRHNADLDPEFLKRKPLKDWLFFGIGDWREWRGIYATFALGGIYAAITVCSDLTGLGPVWSAIIVWGIAIVIGVVILLEKARRSKF